MSYETIRVGQLICDSTTPPEDRGFYKIDEKTTGIVGDLVFVHPVSGKESVPVHAVTSQGWGIGFDEPTASAIRRVCRGVSAPRPKRWITSDAIPLRAYCSDHQYLYGIATGTQHQVSRYDYLNSGAVTPLWASSSNAINSYIIFVWAGADRGLPAGQVFAVVQDKTVSPNTFALYRSTDYAANFSKVLDLGVGAWILDKGFVTHKRNGNTIYSALEYNVRENFTTRPFDGSANDIVRLWESTDQGVTWTQVTAWNVGTHHTRHGHSIDVDPYSDPNNQVLYYGLGDADAECAIVRRDPGAVWPADMSWASIAATPGFYVATGSQACRTVGGIFTPDYYITATDQHSAGTADKANLGVRLWKRDLSSAAHVDRKSGVDSRLVGHNWWFGIKLNNGDLAFLSQPSGSVGETWRGFAILTSADQFNWHFSGWITAPAGTAGQNPRVFAQGSNGAIFVGVDVMAGRPAGSGFGYTTLVCQQTSENFIESRPDILGPVFFVDHAAGNDSNNGLRPSTAWASVRKALQSSAITYGSVVRVLRDGALSEPGAVAVVYNAGSWDVTYSGSGPTDFPVQVRANQSYGATLNWASGTTIIGTGTHRVDIEFDGVGIVPPDAASNWWSSHSTEGASAYRLKDAVFGSKTSNSYFYLKCGTVYAERATVRGGAGAQAFVPEPSNANTKGLEFRASFADLNGNSLVTCNHATLFSPVIDQSTFAGYGSEGAIYIAAAATTKPQISNAAFLDSYRPAIKDGSSTAWTGAEIKRSYIGSGVINGSGTAIPTATADSSNIVGLLSGPAVFGISPAAQSPLRTVAAGAVLYGVDRGALTQPVAGASD